MAENGGSRSQILYDGVNHLDVLSCKNNLDCNALISPRSTRPNMRRTARRRSQSKRVAESWESAMISSKKRELFGSVRESARSRAKHTSKTIPSRLLRLIDQETENYSSKSNKKQARNLQARWSVTYHNKLALYSTNASSFRGPWIPAQSCKKNAILFFTSGQRRRMRQVKPRKCNCPGSIGCELDAEADELDGFWGGLP